MPRPAGPPPEVKAERKRRESGRPWTAREIAKELRISTFVALGNTTERAKYFAWLKMHKPALFVELLKVCMREKDNEGPAALTFVVQQVAISGAPVAGVTNSPIAGHIAGPPQAANTGEVIDLEPEAAGVANG